MRSQANSFCLCASWCIFSRGERCVVNGCAHPTSPQGLCRRDRWMALGGGQNWRGSAGARRPGARAGLSSVIPSISPIHANTRGMMGAPCLRNPLVRIMQLTSRSSLPLNGYHSIERNDRAGCCGFGKI
jgi:hypothetical protein